MIKLPQTIPLKVFAARQPEFVQAVPMIQIDFSIYARIAMPMGADPEAKGYLVVNHKYGLLKHPDHHGFISWMSKSDFEQQYQEF